MQIEISVPEVVKVFKEIQAAPEKLFEMIRFNVQEEVGNYLSQLMNLELTRFLKRRKYQRVKGAFNYRNGGYHREFTLKGIGAVEVKVPRDRQARFQTKVLPRSKRYEEAISRDISMMFLSGISTRSLSMISERLIGRHLSAEEISLASKDLSEAVEKWRLRDLSKEKIKYLFIDGVNFSMRIARKVETIPVLVVIGVSQQGLKLVLAIQMGDKESATNWRELFKDLKSRGINGQGIVLGIMDGLAGLEKVFEEEFPEAKIQRCQVHVARNVLAKVPRRIKKEVADDLRSIFYASSQEKARVFSDTFKDKWAKEIPSAVTTLERSLKACLTFFNFPEEEWISLRTTNIIERLHKEFKRRTKPMEIVAGEIACYRLLAFISLKMELHWRSNPVGKVRHNLPFFKNFTQNI
jgi:putative transposase